MGRLLWENRRIFSIFIILTMILQISLFSLISPVEANAGSRNEPRDATEIWYATGVENIKGQDEGSLNSVYPYSNGIRVKHPDFQNIQFIGYCLNKYKHFPLVGDNIPYEAYTAFPTEDLINSLQHPRGNAVKGLEKVLYYGYPYDHANLKNKYKLTDVELELVTAMAVHYFTDGGHSRNTPQGVFSYLKPKSETDYKQYGVNREYTIRNYSKLGEPYMQIGVGLYDVEKRAALSKPLIRQAFDELIGREGSLPEPDLSAYEWTLFTPHGGSYVSRYQRILSLQPRQNTVKFIKIDETGNLPLGGAKFKLTKLDPPFHSSVLIDNKLYTYSREWVSSKGNRGYTLDEYISPGKYRLEEVEAPEGYTPIKPVEFTLHGNYPKIGVIEDPRSRAITINSGNKDGKVSIEYEPLPDYRIHNIAFRISNKKEKLFELEFKKQNTKKEALEGATIQILDNKQREVDSWMTKANEEYHKTKALRPGTYIFKETVAPKGYLQVYEFIFDIKDDGKVEIKKPKPEGIEVINSKDGSKDNAKLIVTDKEYPEITVVKKDDQGQKVIGANLQITKDGQKVGEHVTEINKDWRIKLEPGRYILSETKVPSGYQKANNIAFKVEHDKLYVYKDGKFNLTNNLTIEMVDKKIPTTSVTVSKVWSGGKPVPVTLSLLANNQPTQYEVTLQPASLSHEFTNLPTVDEHGTNITYTVVEKNSVDKQGKKIITLDKQLFVVTYQNNKVTNTFVPKNVKHELATTVKANGKTGAANKPVSLKAVEAGKHNVVDTISYKGLKGNEEFTVTGTLMDVTNVGEIKEVKQVSQILNSSATGSGSWQMTFTDVLLEPGKTYVVFEEAVSVKDFDFASEDGSSVVRQKQRAEHKNPSDKAQTVVVEEPVLPKYSDGKLATTVKANGQTGAANKPVSLTAVEAGKVKTVVDTISYKGLKGNEEFTVTGTLMDVTGGGKPVEVKKVSQKLNSSATGSGTWDMTFSDVLLEPGKTYVVFEEAVSVNEFDFASEDGSSVVRQKQRAEHKNPSDKAQTVVVENNKPQPKPQLEPEIRTVAKLKDVSSHAKSVELPYALDVTIVDTITWKNLTAGSYRAEATYVKNHNGSESKAKASTKFDISQEQARTGSGTVKVDVLVPKGELLADGVPAKFTVFERVYKLNAKGQIETPGKPVAEHVEKNDDDQTVTITVNKPKDKPKLNKNRVHELATTVKVGSKSADKNTPVTLPATEAGKAKSVVDTISYKGLKGNEEFTVTGTLMDVTGGSAPKEVAKATKKLRTDSSGNGIWEVEFTNPQIKPGKTYVVFEEAVSVKDFEFASEDGSSIVRQKQRAEHKNPSDKAQTVVVEEPVLPKYSDGKLATTVKANGQTGAANKPVSLTAVEAGKVKTVVDTISYKGLKGNEEFTVTGTLMDVTGGGKPVEVKKVSQKLNSSATGSGTWDMTFSDVLLEPGKTYVVFEEAVSVNEFDFASEDGSSVVRQKQRAEHKNPSDKAQTIVVENNKPQPKPQLEPEIRTVAKVDGVKSVVLDQLVDVRVVDTITWKNLPAGSYRAVASFVLNSGEQESDIAGSVDFVVTREQAKSGSGTVKVNVLVPKGELLADGVPARFTVFERVYKLDGQGQIETHGKPVAEHVEKDDDDQTVTITVNKPKDKPKYSDGKLATTVKANGQTGAANKPVSLTAVEAGKVKTVVDTIAYSGLKPNEDFTVTATLMDVTDSDSPKEVAKATKKLRTDNSGSGTWEMTFSDVTLEPGKTYVVFEEAVSVKDFEFASEDGSSVVRQKQRAVHKDVNDKAQTVVVENNKPQPKPQLEPEIRTVAKVDGVKSVVLDQLVDVRVVDTITWKNLPAGSYIAEATYVKNHNGSESEIKGSVKFDISQEQARTGSGTVKVDVLVPKGELLADGVPAKFTVFERVYKLDGQGQIETPGKPVAEHVEKDDDDQTVTITVNKPKDKPKDKDKPKPKPELKLKKKNELVDTGFDLGVLWVVVGLLVVGGGLTLLRRKDQ